MDTILILGIIAILFLFGCFCYCIKNSELFGNSEDTNITVYILNHKRPHNLELSLPLLSQMDHINQIIVSHGSPEGFKDFKYKNVQNIKDYSNNELYGAGRRFLIDPKIFKNNLILTLDDDHIPSSELIDNMLENASKDQDQIYGPYERGCTEKGYEFNPPRQRQNVVLTGIALTSKKVFEEFKNKFDVIEPILKKYNGNGDDLTFNYIFRKNFKKNPKYVNGDYIELDTKGGYSYTKGHNERRNEICKDLSKL